MTGRRCWKPRRLLAVRPCLRLRCQHPGLGPLKAYYEGDSNHTPSTSAILVEQVNAVAGSAFEVTASYPADDFDVFSVAAGDFNGGGKADLAAVGGDTSGFLDIFIGNGDRTFQPAIIYSIDNYPQTVAVADFNGDGIADIAVDGTGEASSLNIFIGNGDGTFRAAISYSVFSSFNLLAVGDFNGDGKADLLAGGELALGNGDGTFQSALAICTCNIASASVGDFNGDGKADVAFTQGSSQGAPGTASVMLGNGDAPFQPPWTIGIDADAKMIAVGDFNGDGKLDIAVAIDFVPIFGPGSVCEVSILLGNGDGTLQPPVSYTVDCPWSIQTDDFNGDGKADLGVGNEAGPFDLLLGMAMERFSHQ